MNYLIWSSIDMEQGLGGVETHARAVARELTKLGVKVHFSMNPMEPWDKKWDVIHTHGSQFYGPKAFMKSSELPVSTIWLHTLHGWTHERVAACREYFWPRAYSAIFNEYVGAIRSDHVFAIHDNLSFLHKMKSLSICSNGWDSWEEGRLTAMNLSKTYDEKWLFIGRGSDPVKGVEKLKPLLSNLSVVAVPGEGFEDVKSVERAGRLNAFEIKRALSQASGLLLTSLHEGLPLVVLEALALGTAVVTTKVGGLKTLSERLQGLYFCKDDLSDLVELTSLAEKENSQEKRRLRAENNRSLLKTWKNVSEHIYQKIMEIQVRKGLISAH